MKVMSLQYLEEEEFLSKVILYGKQDFHAQNFVVLSSNKRKKKSKSAKNHMYAFSTENAADDS
jgi:hypothetical protein